MKISTILLSGMMFLFSAMGFAADMQSSANDTGAGITSTAPTGGSTSIFDVSANNGEINHGCSCEGTQACSVSCSHDKSAKCGKDIYGYCSCSCQ